MSFYPGSDTITYLLLGQLLLALRSLFFSLLVLGPCRLPIVGLKLELLLLAEPTPA